MCLAVPARVEAVLSGDRARVSVGGIRKEISVALVDDVQEGEFVILHVGYALGKIDEDEAQRTLSALLESGIDLEEEFGPAESGDATAAIGPRGMPS